MSQDHITTLAALVLNDGKIVSYRLLSRQLKVHSNIAKRMLYDFYQTQTAKKPGSVHATYLIDGLQAVSSGIQINGGAHDGDDVPMQSSPYMSSSAPQGDEAEQPALERCIVLVREEELDEVKARFSQIFAVHIYSLQPSALQNLQTLSDCNRAVASEYNEDPLVVGKQYGVIQNRDVKRRTIRRPPGVAPSVEAAQKSGGLATKVQTDSTKGSQTSVQEQKHLAGSGSRRDQPKGSGSISASKPAGLKREQSDIFKSFAKPKAQIKREDTDNSTSESQDKKQPESQEVVMKDVSDDEGEDDFVAVNKADPKSTNMRKERAEQLRKMMEDDDEDEGEASKESAAASPEAGATDRRESEKAPSPEPPVVVQAGRRRGRRKIMKKKTTKDEEGYLVTKEEPAWESFSEDEPAPRKEQTPASSAASTNKRKSGGKPGQGNIMSFFGKK